MENQEKTSTTENFLLYVTISAMVLGVIALTAFIASPDENVFSSVKTKWKNRKTDVENPEEIINEN